jgi:hypothetical protein
MEWQYVGSILGGIVGIVGAFVGVWQYLDKRSQSNREPFLKQQMDYCFRACDAVGRMIAESDPEKWKAARADFWALYWGTLAVVEDRSVEAAMVAMGRLVPPPEAPAPRAATH